ncbi:MAG: DUF1697 domain-containing protein [Gemmatimonadetes bacterium]|nr:DUF1697 domain-containing protein [Gemmatimonadota bacterium]
MAKRKDPDETYLALLRGINVGGKNIIRMADLRSCFEDQGFRDVATYIQSGNVIFRTPSTGLRTLTKRIEEMLATAFDYEASVVMRARKQMRAVISEAPAGFGDRPETFRYDVIYLKAPLTASAAMEGVPTRPGVDEAWVGSGVLYFSRRIDQASRSYLSRLASMPVYQRVTVRNWNTTTRLLELMEKD